MEAISHDVGTWMGRATCYLVDHDGTMQYERSMSPGYFHITAYSIRANLRLIVTCVIEIRLLDLRGESRNSEHCNHQSASSRDEGQLAWNISGEQRIGSFHRRVKTTIECDLEQMRYHF